ncbi:MAG: anti-sigma factor family protein [Caldicoprobacterales bacterium]|nr:hypothetical protein [Clostridiales bacterium]
MNSCEYSKYLSDYIDRQLTPKQEIMLEEHLPFCSDCKNEWEELTMLKKACSNLSEEQPHPSLHRRIMLKVQRLNKPVSRITWVKQIGASMAAVVLLFLIGKGVSGIIGYAGRDLQVKLEQENTVMSAPEAESPAEESSVIDMQAAAKVNEELSGVKADSSKDEKQETVSSNNAFFDIPVFVKYGIGAALLLVFAFFLIKLLRLK